MVGVPPGAPTHIPAYSSEREARLPEASAICGTGVNKTLFSQSSWKSLKMKLENATPKLKLDDCYRSGFPASGQCWHNVPQPCTEIYRPHPSHHDTGVMPLMLLACYLPKCSMYRSWSCKK